MHDARDRGQHRWSTACSTTSTSARSCASTNSNTKFTQVTLDLDHDFTDRLSVRGLAGHAKSDHNNPVQTTLLFDPTNVDGYSYDYRGNDRLPLITYGATNLDNAGDVDPVADPPAAADRGQHLLDTVQGDLRLRGLRHA